MITLRPYQKEAIDAVIRARKQGLRRLLICLPTGSGKTVIFSHLARLARRPVLVLAHREELLEQAREKIARALDGQGKAAIEQGSRKAPKDAKVVVASLRSLRPQRLARLKKQWDFGLIVYDECHHAAAEDNQRILREIGVFERDWTGTLLGFTATTQRGDGKGLECVFEDIVYARDLRQMIDDRYLSPLRGYRIATEADLRQVTAGGQDFQIEELAEVIDIQERNALVARAIQELARDRRIIVFCVTIAHARNLAKALNHVGVRCGIIHGKLKPEARAKVLDEFRKDQLQCLTNVAVLTEGFDEPSVSCIAMARPTRSQGLYAQCVGRGTRLHPGKKDCLILDFVDVSDLDLVTLPSLFGLPKDLNLQGEEAVEASKGFQQLLFDHPGFEVEPGEITLSEIKRRAAGFDPLNLAINDEVLAISQFAWTSLGRHGLGLSIEKGRHIIDVLVLKKPGRGRRYQVLWAGKEKARFSHIEEAVEAVDYEVSKLGRKVSKSALESAPWRRSPVPPAISHELSELGIKQSPRNHGEARRLLLLALHAGRR